jgi:phage FluMu gp28-like protein
MKPTVSVQGPTLPPLIQVLDYQKRWVEDRSKLKIADKGRQLGFSWAATLRAIREGISTRLAWIFLSAGERQSKLLMEKAAEHVHAMGAVAEYVESSFFEGTLLKQLELRLGNGTVIYGLPANPETARGYSGNTSLDEFAFHKDADKIYTALYPSITRGYSLEVISTPNGKQGKYFDLAKKAGLVDGEARDPDSAWSAHRVDIYDAAAQGLAGMVPATSERLSQKLLDDAAAAFAARGVVGTRHGVSLQRMVRFIAALRAGVDLEEDWLQEYCCQFISTAENFIPPELLRECISSEASESMPPLFLLQEPGECFLGIDIGRHHDRTVFWLDRVTVGAVREPPLPGQPPPQPRKTAVARLVETLNRTPFQQQMDRARELLSLKRKNGEYLIRRACIDATGMGAPLAEGLSTEFGPRVEPITFTAAAKEDMAFRTRRFLEGGQSLIPGSPDIQRAFASVKKVVTATGNIRFDAERTEAGHADQFWAKALADLAADSAPVSHLSDGVIVGRPRAAEWMPSALPAEF